MLIRSTPPLFAALLLLAACASPEAAPPEPFRPAGAVAARGVGCGPLFISPSGEPFRADPERPDAGCPMHAWFARADTNGDGALTRTEFREDALRFFAELDADGSGYLDGAELQFYEHRIAPEILGGGRDGPRAALDGKPRLLPVALQLGGGQLGGQGGGGFGGGGGGFGGGGGPGSRGDPPDEKAAPKTRLEGGAGLARFGLLDEPEPVAAADLNFDGRITRAEFATRADQRFASLDEAETGRLTYPDLERRLRTRRGARPDGSPSTGGGRRGGGGRGGRGGGGFGGSPQG